MRVAQLRRLVRDRLLLADLPSPDADATAITARAVGVPPSQLALASDPDQAMVDRALELADRRAARVPLQHLLGTAGFRTIELAVGPGVFVPRPETEVLVGEVLARLELDREDAPAGSQPQIVVDLCSGSGAVALAIAAEAPGVQVFAVEREDDAFAWLRRNCAALPGVTAVQADATRVGLPGTPLAELAGRVAAVACNPPYIPADCVPRDPEVAEHDPVAALYGGADGLDVVRGVLRPAAALLRRGGVLAIEHGDAQGVAAGPLGVPATVVAAAEFHEVQDVEDLTGRPRVTLARRR